MSRNYNQRSFFNESYWRDRIDDIIDNFDFNKVAIAMKSFNWTWAFANGLRIPTAKELQQNARRMMKNICFSKDYANDESVECGGFIVEINRNNGYLKLVFGLESRDSYLEEDILKKKEPTQQVIGSAW